MIRILVVLTFFAAAFAEKVTISNCGNGEVIFVDLTPCPSKTNGNCNLKKGSNVTFTFQFRASKQSNTAIICGQASVKVILKSVTYNIPCYNTCPQIQCPVTVGSINTIKETFKLDSPASANNVKFEMKVTGDNKVLLACANFHINIK